MSEIVPSQALQGTASALQDRLARWRRVVDAECLDRLRLSGGENVLDVGSGPATLALEVARLAGRPVVRITDGSTDDILTGGAAPTGTVESNPLLDERSGDLHDLPIREAERGTFDLVHCSFVLSRVRRPQQILEGLARAVRPGGRMVLVADDLDQMRMWPSMPAVDEIWRAYVRAFIDDGHDPFVGRKLVAMMQVAGLEPRRVESIPFGGCTGSEHWELAIANLADRLVQARAGILDGSAIPRDVFDEVLESLHAWSQRSGATLWSPVCWGEAEKS